MNTAARRPAILLCLHLLACLACALLCGPASAFSPQKPAPTSDVQGTIDGLHGVAATVTLGHDGFLLTGKTDASGHYVFHQVPWGTYFIKAEANGYATGPARQITVPANATQASPSRATSTSLRQAATGSTAAATPTAPTGFQAVALPNDHFSYHWAADVSRSGYETSAGVNQVPQITFLNESITPADPSSANSLQHDYNIILSNQDVTWTQEYASRLLAMMKVIPQPVGLNAQNQPLKPSKWVLTNLALPDDIHIVRSDAGDVVTISSATMAYAAPRMVLIDGVKGTFFSKRLHHALVRFVTNDGADIPAVEKILSERFGVSIMVPDYTALTANTTQEDKARFTQFRPRELIEIINMFEEMPDGFHVVKGLKYLVRRNFGQRNPKVFCVAAVAFPAAGYIEFVDGAFTYLPYTHQTIVHEKSHFMWAFLFSDKLKASWAKLGGWYPDSTAKDGWATSQTTTFVSAYAHLKNPNEDMAESIAAFVLNPSELKSRALGKYEFIRDNIMHGASYAESVRSDLQFEVLNLFPDYDYPGKIMRVDVSVDGAPEADKSVTIEIELNTQPGKFDAAQTAYMILRAPNGTYKELWFNPKGGGSTGHVLTGTLTISQYAKGGFWQAEQVRVIDAVGNTRYEGPHDFGWKMLVNNPREDTSVPHYVPHSLAMKLQAPATVDGHTVQKLLVSWQVDASGPINELNDMYCALLEKNSGMLIAANGRYDAASKTASVEFDITEFFASGQYQVPYLSVKNAAGLRSWQYFSDSPKDELPSSITIVTPNPDYLAPELDVNRITIEATPSNPQTPNGETLVRIVFYARDDKAGIRNLYYTLLDPQGLSHNFYFAAESWKSRFFQGDPTLWTRYEITETLPVGSAPGKWGLANIEIHDQANNLKNYNFLEILHFEIAP
jgi:hypothetical protein